MNTSYILALCCWADGQSTRHSERFGFWKMHVNYCWLRLRWCDRCALRRSAIGLATRLDCTSMRLMNVERFGLCIPAEQVTLIRLTYRQPSVKYNRLQ